MTAGNKKLINIKRNEMESITQYKSSSSSDACGFSEKKIPACMNIYIGDKFLQNNGQEKRQTTLEKSLEKAFNDCLISVNTGLTHLDSYLEDDHPNRELSHNGSISDAHSNLYNCEEKILLSDLLEQDSSYGRFGFKNGKTCYKKIKKTEIIKKPTFKNVRRTVNGIANVPRPKPRSRQEITVGVPNILFDKSHAVQHCKKTLEDFLQNNICLSLPCTIDKCIECNLYQIKKNLTKRDYDNISCRFYAFRQLRFNKCGSLSVAGYPDPFKASNADLSQWLPGKLSRIPNNFNIEMSTKIIEDIGGQLCKFFQFENQALVLNSSKYQKQILWKKSVNGVREMCDVCKTSIFNYHWSCTRCGFVVCIDCYNAKFGNNNLVESKFGPKSWLFCSNHIAHQADQLALTQILAGNSLNILSKCMHDVCKLHNIPLDCNCELNLMSDDIDLSSSNLVDDLVADLFLENVHISKNCRNSLPDDEIDDLKTILYQKSDEHFKYFGADEINVESDSNNYDCNSQDTELNFKSCWRKQRSCIPHLSLMVDNHLDAPHMWLCEGYLLRLMDPKCNANYKLFQVFKNIKYSLIIVLLELFH